MRNRPLFAIGTALLAVAAAGHAEDYLEVPGLSGRAGGRLVYSERTEPKTLNPLLASDNVSRDIIHRLSADLVHINRATLRTEPALAERCTISPDGLRYTLDLRHGLRFSDGQPFDADDVIFTFKVYLDEKIDSPQRNLWILDGRPVRVRKLDTYRVEFELPRANAVGDRIFDSVPILPRHLLEGAYREGKLLEAWGLGTPPGAIAGLGPFRFKQYVPGQRVVLERNPYYWKRDAAGNRLPYLSELDFSLDGGEDMQVLRFEAGESDMVEPHRGPQLCRAGKTGRAARLRSLRRRPGVRMELSVFQPGAAGGVGAGGIPAGGIGGHRPRGDRAPRLYGICVAAGNAGGGGKPPVERWQAGGAGVLARPGAPLAGAGRV